jgi:hypothetical protein
MSRHLSYRTDMPGSAPTQPGKQLFDSINQQLAQINAWIRNNANPSVAGARSVANFGVKGIGAVGESARIQEAVEAANAENFPLLVPYGSYNMESTVTIPDGVSLVAYPLGNGHNAGFYHNFNGDMFLLEGGGALGPFYLINNGAYTGAAIHGKTNAVSKGFLTLDRIVVTDFTSKRGWQRDLVLDGSAAIGPPVGYRSIFLKDCQFFGAYEPLETVVLNRCVHVFGNFEIIEAPQEGVEVGMKILDKQSGEMVLDANILGGLEVAAANGVNLRGLVGKGTIKCLKESANNRFYVALLKGASLANEGEASNVTV